MRAQAGTLQIETRAIRTAVLAAAGIVAATAGEPTTPEGVSPGSPGSVLTVSGSCPTFSWAADPGEGFELAIFEPGEDGDLDDRRIPLSSDSLVVSLPAGALSWTPAVEQCLEVGPIYAWAIRAVTDGLLSEWSQPLLFRVSAKPTAHEVARATEILSQALELPRSTTERDRVAGVPGPGAFGTGTSGVSAPIGVDGDSALVVDGVVEVYGLESLQAGAQVPGNIVAEGDLSAPLGVVETSVVYLSPDGELAGVTWLRSPALGELAIGRGQCCDADADIWVDQLVVGSLSTGVLKSFSGLGWIGSGGSGVTTVPLNGSDQLRLDSAGDECPGGSVATGLRLKKVDTNQAGVELECSN